MHRAGVLSFCPRPWPLGFERHTTPGARSRLELAYLWAHRANVRAPHRTRVRRRRRWRSLCLLRAQGDQATGGRSRLQILLRVRQESLRAPGAAKKICLAGMFGFNFCGCSIHHHPADGIYFEGEWGCGHLAMSDSSRFRGGVLLMRLANRHIGFVRVEYDASRFKEPVVANLLRGAGLDIGEKLIPA